jgi:Flp pilus assembly CpaF family ATPase
LNVTSCVLQSGVELPYRAIKNNIAGSLNVIVQLERRPGRRYVSEILEIHAEKDHYKLTPAYDGKHDKTDAGRRAELTVS